MKVRSLMTTAVVTIHPETPLKEAAELMTRNGVGGLPVVDESGRLVGMLTEADFVARTSASDRAGLLRSLFEPSARLLRAETAGQAMSRDLVTVSPESSHTAAASLMKRKSVKRLPVVDDQGALVGIVSRSDILGVYARSDSEIRDEIINRIMGQVVAVDHRTTNVQVEHGRVHLSGTLPTRPEVRLVEELAGTVAGVIGVDSDLAYRTDDTAPEGGPRPAGIPVRHS